MEISEHISLGATAPVAKRSFSHGLVSMSSGVLPLLDVLCLIVAAWLGTELVLHGSGGPALAGVASALTPAAWVAVALAPFLLYDPHFGSLAGRGRVTALLRSHALRFTLFAVVVLALGVLAQTLHGFAPGWLLLWFALGLLLSSLTRLARWPSGWCSRCARHGPRPSSCWASSMTSRLRPAARGPMARWRCCSSWARRVASTGSC